MSIRARHHPVPIGILPDRLVRDAWWLAEPAANDESSQSQASPQPRETAPKPAARLVVPDCQMS